MSERAVIYTRISRDREGAGLGVERQEQDCRELGARLGLTVAEVYADNDLSATNLRRPRPGYRQMCADLDRPGAPRVVLSWHTDRLHRQPRELEDWIDLAEARGIVVNTVKAGPIDLVTPAGQMIARQLGAVARYESQHKAERVARKMAQIRDDGGWHGGPVPFGWRRAEKGRLELNPAEAALVVRGTRMLLGGRSLGAIVETFNASGLRSHQGRGAPWGRKTVARALARWANAGLVTHRDQPIGPATWPALADLSQADSPKITADDVRAVRQILAANAANRHQHRTIGNATTWLLGGIARCTCGAPMRSSSGGAANQTRPVYRCTAGGPGHVTRHIPPLDEFIRELVAARLREPDLADLLAPPADDVDPAALRAEADAARTNLEALAVMLGDATLDPAGYKVAAGRARARLDAAEAALSASLRRSPLAPVLAAADPGAAFLAAGIDVQRTVVRELLDLTLYRPARGARFDLDSVVRGIVWRHQKWQQDVA
jgi:site-specific DNA recombinase